MRERDEDDEENLDSEDYYKFYINVSRSFGLVWFILSICFAVALILVFIQPDWIGDTNESASRGYFGVFRFCVRSNVFHTYTCYGDWNDFGKYPDGTTVFKVSSVFILIAIILSIVVILVSLVSFCVKFERIFHICSWIQFITSESLTFFITLFVALNEILFSQSHLPVHRDHHLSGWMEHGDRAFRVWTGSGSVQDRLLWSQMAVHCGVDA